MIYIVVGIIELVEGIAFLIVTVRQVIKLIRFAKHGVKLKQVKLENVGRMITFIGTIVIIIIPQIAGFQNSYGGSLFLITSVVGFCLFLMGIRFINIAYKTEDENPKWVKWILKACK